MQPLTKLITALLLLTITAFSAAATSAQGSATPAAPTLDYPEIDITAKDLTFDLPAEVAAGRYLITLDNQSPEGIDGQLILVPAERTADEIISAFLDPNEAAAWLYDATFGGGPTVLAGKQGQTIVDLTEGTWVLVATGYTPATLTVTAAENNVPSVEPEASATIELQEYAFVGLEDGIQAGQQVWKVTNVGAQPHFLELIKTPRPVTMDQVMAVLMAGPGATPAPGGLDPATIEGVGGIATISPGTTAWYITDLAPGTYVALCFVPDKDSGAPHAMMGMIQVFTVE